MAQAFSQRLPFIDALRGLAAIYVLLFHLTFIGNVPGPQALGSLLFVGGSAVNIFFMVSAFSLGASSDDADATRGTLGRFWIRRFWRIAPMFYLITLLECLHLRGSPAEPRAGAIAANLLFGFGLFPDYKEGIPLGGWTVGVEMLFYTIFPLFLARSRHSAGMALLCAGSVILAFCAGPAIAALTPRPLTGTTEQLYFFYFYESLLIRLPLFMAGLACFRIYMARLSGRSLPPVLGLAIIALACLLISGWMGWEGRFIFNVTAAPPTLAALANTAVVHQLAQCTIWGILLIGLSIYPLALFVNRVTLFFGRISYSVYLLHLPIIVALRPVYGRIATYGLMPGAAYLIDAAITLAIVSAAAWLCFHSVEKPGMRAGKWLAARVPNGAIALK